MYILIKLPWLEYSANTYMRNIEQLFRPYWDLSAVHTVISTTGDRTSNTRMRKPLGHQSRPHISDAKSTSHGKNARPYDLMSWKYVVSLQRTRPSLGLYNLYRAIISIKLIERKLNGLTVRWVFFSIVLCDIYIYIYIYIYNFLPKHAQFWEMFWNNTFLLFIFSFFFSFFFFFYYYAVFLQWHVKWSSRIYPLKNWPCVISCPSGEVGKYGYGAIFGSNRSVLKLFVFDWTMRKKNNETTTRKKCKYKSTFNAIPKPLCIN